MLGEGPLTEVPGQEEGLRSRGPLKEHQAVVMTTLDSEGLVGPGELVDATLPFLQGSQLLPKQAVPIMGRFHNDSIINCPYLNRDITIRASWPDHTLVYRDFIITVLSIGHTYSMRLNNTIKALRMAIPTEISHEPCGQTIRVNTFHNTSVLNSEVLWLDQITHEAAVGEGEVLLFNKY